MIKLNFFFILHTFVETEPFLKGAQVRLALVTGFANYTSSPCLINNGNCDHVCIIVDAKTYAKVRYDLRTMVRELLGAKNCFVYAYRVLINSK